MSPITGIILFVMGSAMLLMLRGENRRPVLRDAAGVLGSAVFLAGFIGAVGYLFGTPLLYGGQIIPLAIPTVTAVLLMGAGLIAAGGPGGLILKPFAGASIRAHLLRVFLPLTALMILAHGFLHEIVAGALGLNSALWEALLTVVFVLVTGVVVARASQSLSRIIDAATAERRRTEAALRESTRLFQTLARMSPVGIFRTNAAGQCVYMNERWCEMAGMPVGDALGRGWIEAVHPEDREHVHGEWERCVRQNAAFKMEYRLRRPEGLVSWVLGQAIPETDAASGKGGHVGTVTDITPSKQMEQKIIDLALTDQLTGLYNRRGFMMLTEQQLKAASRQRQGMILFFADLDYLKRINDTLGHEEGDRAIVGTAAVLRETFRESDIIARIGGDEFAILAINTGGDADRLLKRLRERIAVANRRQGRRYELSLSVGIAYYDPETPCSLDALISQADTLMYEQKKGRNGAG
jgi:diguanylate cyclase (GGDEF)-like protein/PAS domain S-box-containing protein